MRTTLISFLGNRKEDGEYLQVQYLYNDELQPPVTYIGYALQKIVQPDRFVILGTTGTMWHHLFESDLQLKAEYEDERLALIESVEDKKHVSQEQLDKLAPLLSKALGIEVILKIIPAARTQEEQIAVLEQIDAVLEEDSGFLYLDVTHGFRSLPMVSFAAVQFLNTVKPKIKVKNIFYGELTEDGGYIHELSAMLSLTEWNKAFYHSESTGDYSLIAELLPEEEKEIGELISQASFFESIHLVGQARGTFDRARKLLQQREFTGPAALFKPVLMQRTEWVEEKHFYLRQQVQAFRSLENNDYLRAALYGYEAYLTTKMTEHPEYRNHSGNAIKRSEFAQMLKDGYGFENKQEKEGFRFLRRLRNALAHGEESHVGEIRSAIHNSKELHERLESVLNLLLKK